MGVPAPHLGCQPVHDLSGAFGLLAGQSPSPHDALQGLGQVQPGASDRGVQRQDAVLDAPVHQRWGVMPLEVIQLFRHRNNWIYSDVVIMPTQAPHEHEM